MPTRARAHRWLVLVALQVALVAGLAACTSARDDAEQSVRVLPLGDSITFGNTGAPGAVPGGYRGYLSAMLDDAETPHRFVGTSTLNPPPGGEPTDWAHDGWPGFRIDQVDVALTGSSPVDGGQWLTGTASRAPIDPDIAIVHLGTNDIGQAWDPGVVYPGGGYTATDPAERATFVDHLVDRLVAMVETLHTARPDAAVVLCTIVPMVDATAADYNRAIREVAIPRLQDAGVTIALADVAAAFESVLATGDGGGPVTLSAQPNPWVADGVHPTATGYELMAEPITDAVVDLAAELDR